jgi:FkbM family methyltransferase
MRKLVFVGCNIGKDVDRAVDAHDVCWLFEPIPEIAAELRRKYNSRSFPTKVVHVVQKACYTHKCTMPFHLYNTNGLSSSLGTVSQESQSAYNYADLSLIDTIDVECVNLNEFLPAGMFIDTLIVDAQGADLQILQTLQSRLYNKLFGLIESECDGNSFSSYDGIGSNSESEMLSYMSQFEYDCERIPDRVDWNPDYRWKLR